MVEIPQEHDFLTWSIQNLVRKVKQFVRKYFLTRLIELANKFYNKEEFIISFYTMCYQGLSCFIKKFCRQSYFKY